MSSEPTIFHRRIGSLEDAAHGEMQSMLSRFVKNYTILQYCKITHPGPQYSRESPRTCAVATLTDIRDKYVYQEKPQVLPSTDLLSSLQSEKLTLFPML